MTDFTGSNTPAEHRDSWRTPPEIFAALNAEFVFQLDAAASEKNRLCRLFISQEQNTLTTSWPEAMGYASGYVWLNPPYSNISPFVKKAATENKFSSVGCVMLLLLTHLSDGFMKRYKPPVRSDSSRQDDWHLLTHSLRNPSVEIIKARCSLSGTHTPVHTATLRPLIVES